MSGKLKYCPKCQSKLDYIYQHPEEEIMWKLMGYRDRYSDHKIERTKEEIKTLEDKLNDKTKEVGFFYCSKYPKCDFKVMDDGLGYLPIRR